MNLKLIILLILAFAFFSVSGLLAFFFPRNTSDNIDKPVSISTNTVNSSADLGVNGGELVFNSNECQAKITFPKGFLGQNVKASIKENKTLPAAINENAKMFCPITITFDKDPQIKIPESIYDEGVLALTVEMNVDPSITKNMNYVSLLASEGLWVPAFVNAPTYNGGKISQELFILDQPDKLTLNISLQSIPKIKGS